MDSGIHHLARRALAGLGLRRRKHRTFNAQYRRTNAIARLIIGCSALDVADSVFPGLIFLYKFPADGVYVMKS
jgi:hypothetical protein